MIKSIYERPFVLIIAAFAVLLAAWTVLITVAVKNPAAFVPLKTVATATH